MITRRNYFSIMLMMAVLCGIFMFTMFVQESGSSYDINRFVVEELPTGADRWHATGGEELVLLLGGQDEALCSTVKQWCTYSKRYFLQKETLADFSPENDGIPGLIIFDTKNLDFGKNYRDLVSLAELGVPLVFSGLPETGDFETSPELCEILGVKLKQPEVTVEGLRLFDGFFYGGPAEYIAKTDDDEKLQDFELTIPWLLTGSGTKTYMVGVMEDPSIKREEYPCLIWRNSYNNTRVFAVYGDYMSSLAGLGILSTFMYELKNYELYPVVNAQNIIIDNFPNFTEENTEEIDRLYSRSPQMYFQGIMWPSLSALAKTNALKLTCLFKPQFDYTDTRYPDPDEVHFYLKQLRELESEAGRSLGRMQDNSFNTMVVEDTAFYDGMKLRYRYETTFANEEDLSMVKEALAEGGNLEKIVTVGSCYTNNAPLVSYLTDGTTLQCTTGTAEHHTYREDFTVRSVQTALLYSNVTMDLKNAVWPQKEAHQWQHLFKEMSSNIQSYWSGNSGLEQTTLSQSDYRVRKFLNLDFETEKYGNTIDIRVEGSTDDVWFILRTHDEKVTKVRGGKYKQLDANMYLITAEESLVKITVKPLSLKEQDEQ